MICHVDRRRDVAEPLNRSIWGCSVDELVKGGGIDVQEGTSSLCHSCLCLPHGIRFSKEVARGGLNVSIEKHFPCPVLHGKGSSDLSCHLSEF